MKEVAANIKRFGEGSRSWYQTFQRGKNIWYCYPSLVDEKIWINLSLLRARFSWLGKTQENQRYVDKNINRNITKQKLDKQIKDDVNTLFEKLVNKLLSLSEVFRMCFCANFVVFSIYYFSNLLPKICGRSYRAWKSTHYLDCFRTHPSELKG